MNQISKWFARKASQHTESPSQTDMREPRTSDQFPQECAGDPTHTLPVLTNLDASFFEIADSVGFDPYNSGSFETSKSRSSR